jgi:hypothetical protein
VTKKLIPATPATASTVIGRLCKQIIIVFFLLFLLCFQTKLVTLRLFFSAPCTRPLCGFCGSGFQFTLATAQIGNMDMIGFEVSLFFLFCLLILYFDLFFVLKNNLSF